MPAGRTKVVVTAVMLGLMLLAAPQRAAAQAASPATAGKSSVVKRTVWAAIGAGIGFGAGLLFGVHQFDDAIYAERKMWASALVGAAAGAVAGAVLSADGRPTGLPRTRPALEPSEVYLRIGAEQALPARLRAPAGHGRRLAQPAPSSPAPADPLWEGMAIGAAVGAAVGLIIVPAGNCKPENPECPGVLRLVVGIPAIAVGAALGAAVDKLRK